MKASLLSPHMRVAALNDEGDIEKAVVLSVSGWSKTTNRCDGGGDHLVQFLTGSTRQRNAVLRSREILGPWEDYEAEWQDKRSAELREYASQAFEEYEWSEDVQVLHVVQAALKTLDVNSGVSSLLKAGSNREPALFITVTDAKTLLAHLQQIGIANLTSDLTQNRK